ncbi:hypothetical protein D7Y32_18955 [Stenotrophomonas maltophilia]|nr:hypothetical protein [Stenotrophomonas maltophilia]PZS77986.1 hypothetical protein A7X74_14520 [Stenotrophomonas maltophilia]
MAFPFFVVPHQREMLRQAKRNFEMNVDKKAVLKLLARLRRGTKKLIVNYVKLPWILRSVQAGSPPYRATVPRRFVSKMQALKTALGSQRYRVRGRIEPLTPAHLIGSSYKQYRAELQRALRLPKVRNIAITGGYGAGKSSFIQTFASEHTEYKYCFVSLAAFNSAQGGYPEKAPGSSSDSTSKESIEQIEATIVQQLLYSVEGKTVPQTRHKRISHVSKLWASFYSVLALATVLALVRLFGLPKDLVHLSKEFPISQVLESNLLYTMTVLLLVAFLVIRKAAIAVLGFNLQGLTLKGVTMAPASISSVLHKQVDEIVYLFERSKIDVVFIEDLDRFSDSSPFTRLREINFIVNTSPAIRRPVYFVYLIRGDLFSAEDGVKFFDYVLPIISVINTDNSRQMMINVMRERKWAVTSRPSEALIEAVCYYVDDMRQLLNIVNEYDLFRRVAGGNEYLSVDKMFGAVVAKCLYPREYSRLLKGEGPIYDMIKSYIPWSVNRELEGAAEVAALEAEIDNYTAGLSRSEREYRALAWMAASDQEQAYELETITIPSGEMLGFAAFVNRESVVSILEQNALLSLNFQYVGVRSVESRRLIGDGVGSLRARIASAREVANGAHRRLSILRGKLADERVSALSQAIVHPEFANHVATLEGARALGPLPYLVSSGVLGEDYFDYSGFFYEGSVSRSDKAVLLRIKAGELLPVDTRLDSPVELLKRLTVADLRAGRALITSLAERVFNVDPIQTPMTEHERATLADVSTHSGRLDLALVGLYGSASFHRLIRSALADNGAVLIRLLTGEYQCARSPWRERVSASMISSGRAGPANLDDFDTSALDSIISTTADATSFAKGITSEPEAKEWLDENDTWINSLDENIDRDDVETLLRLDVVRINLHNLRVLAKSFEMSWFDSAISLRELRQLPRGPLRKSILRSAATLVEALLEQDGPVDDDPVDVQWALSKLGRHPELRERLIEHAAFLLPTLSEVEQGLWVPLALKHRIKPTWGNINLITGTLKDQELRDSISGMLRSPGVEAGLTGDIDSLISMSHGQVGSMITTMLDLEGEVQLLVARALGETGAIRFAPESAVPELEGEALEALATSLNGRWLSWLFMRLQLTNGLAAASYLASCADDVALTEGGYEIVSELLIEAMGLVSSPRSWLHLAQSCLGRTTGWTQATGERFLESIQIMDLQVAGAANSVLALPGAREVFTRAALKSSLGILSSMVSSLDWSLVRPIVTGAANGAMSKLLSPGGQVSIENSEAGRNFVDALYRKSLIRKPINKAKNISIQSSAKF